MELLGQAGWGRGPAGAGRRAGALAMLLGLCLLAACTDKGKKNGPVTTVTSVATPVAAPATGPASGSAAAVASPPVASPPTGTPAAKVAAAASRVATVKLAYDLLMDRYYKPLKSNNVLQNAWKGAADAAKRAAGTVQAPRLSGDRNADWEAFRFQYEQLFAVDGGMQGTALAFGAINAMASGLHDDHTYFLSPEDNKRRQADDSGGERFVGVGISISNRAPFTVESVVSGGPADKAGLKVGDQIAAVDGADTAHLSQQELRNRLRGGEAGSTVRLTVKRANGGTDEIAVTRAEIVQPAIEWKVLSGGVGYIALHNFSDAYARFTDGRNIAETLDLALQSFEQAGVKGWVFDVRGDPGGSEQTLAEVAGRFLPDGLVLVSVDRNGQTTEAPVDGHLFATQRPLALLIDGQSGSASELLAATWKEYGRARLFGQRTAGAVNGALESELPDGAALQYTVVEGRTGKDRKLLDGVGVSPDENVSGSGSPADVLAGRADPQFDRAKAWVLDQAKKTPTLSLQPTPQTGRLSVAEIRSGLQPFGARQDDLPAGPARNKAGELVLTQPHEEAIGIASDVPNAAAFIQKERDRRWQGAYQQFFGSGEPAPYAISIDLYADEAGARDAFKTDDYPTALKAVDPGARLGDETTAYAGYGAGEGTYQIVWRRGRLVFTVQYAADPGAAGLGAALDLAKRIDARAGTLKAP